MKKKLILLPIFFTCWIIGVHAQSAKYSSKWLITKPFERNVFIENKGQFPDYQLQGIQDKVLYYTTKGKLKIYYAPDGLVFEHDSIVKMTDAERLIYGGKDEENAKDDGDGKRNLKMERHFVKMQWEGGNVNPQMEVQNPVSDYFTYGNPKDKKGKGITAHGFGKLIYRNVYSGIDVVFYYPEEKGGLEYDVIVHPGADVSAFKMKYTGATALLNNGDIKLSTTYGVSFTDHTPEGTDGNGKKVSTVFSINNSTVSFAVGKYDKSKTLIIDPWFTATAFTGTNSAYDLDYDINGNVYIYGGGAVPEYQEKKYNNAGTLQWTFTTTMPYVYSGAYFYGGMVADERTGTTYICEGFDPSPGDNVIKVNANGLKLSQYAGGGGIDEMWHMAFDYCNNHLLYDVGGGAYDAAYSDTNVTTVTGVNIFGPGVQDQTLVCTDGASNSYIGSCQMVFASVKPNYLAQCILPTLAPVPYQVYDRHPFIEITNISYYPIVGPYAGGNGFNGLVANSKIVVSYDGGTARIWRASNGNEIDSMKPSLTHLSWGGLDLDCKSNIYCGNSNSISVYDSTAHLLNNIPLGGTVYALRWDPRGLVYAAGNGFVQAVTADEKMATTTKVQPGCGCNGSATAIACGVGPFTYSWSNGATTSTITGLCTGSYTVTIKGSGCFPRQDTSIAILTGGGGGGLTLTMSSTPTACGVNTGTATVSVVGGTAPYTYAWNSGQSTSNITALSSGAYCVVVTDKNGCKDSACVNVTNSSGLTVTINIIKNVSCFGGTDGSAYGVVSGGTAPYTYNWSNGQTTDTATGLAIGSYTLSITDVNGCNTSAIVHITQPSQLRDSITVIVNPLCSAGATGSATVGVTGGTGKYTYSWNSFPIQTNAKASNLSAGTYTVTVTDSNGCTNTATATLVAPAPITITTTTVPSACIGSSGSATATPAGGTGAYTYKWNPSAQTNATATSLSSGTYTVTVTDANGCTGTATAIVGNVGGETDTIVDVINVKCFGAKTASATDSAIGGTPAYTYSWAPGGQTTATATGLSAGTYTATTKDSRGCIATAIITITQPPQLRDSIISTRGVACAGMTNGSATVGVKGGTAPYTFIWAPMGGTADSGVGLGIGTYTVTVKDANGCTVSASATITSPPALKIIAAAFPTTCNDGNDGQATVIPSSGNPPYTYLWAPGGQTNANIDDLTAGTYTITITDSHGCSHDTAVTVTQPPALLVGFSSDTLHGCGPLCVNFSDMSTDPIPGDTIKHWSWSYGDGGTDTIQNPKHCYVGPGTYSVRLTVTSKRGCSNSLTIANMITVYNNPVADFTVSPQPTTIFQPTIQFTDKSTDTYGIVSWLWNFQDPANDTANNLQNPTHTYQDTGIYCPMLTVTNIHGCKDSITHCLVISPQYTLYIPDAFSPNGDGRDDIFLPRGEYIATYSMYIFDRWGMKIFQSTDITQGWNGGVNGGSRICEEDTYVYLINVTDNLGKKHSYLGKVTLIK
jgi:gliding motility-associated-like protein